MSCPLRATHALAGTPLLTHGHLPRVPSTPLDPQCSLGSYPRSGKPIPHHLAIPHAGNGGPGWAGPAVSARLLICIHHAPVVTSWSCFSAAWWATLGLVEVYSDFPLKWALFLYREVSGWIKQCGFPVIFWRSPIGTSQS
jgi:hypothetical protein